MPETEDPTKNHTRFVRALIDLMPAIVTIVAIPSGDTLYTNRPDIASQIHPDDLPTLKAYYESFAKLDDNGIIGVEYRLSNDKGEWTFLSAQGKVFLRDNEDIPTQALIVARDLTQRKRTELEILRLKRHEQNQSFLASITKDLVELDNRTDAIEALGEKIASYFRVPWCTFAELTEDETSVSSYGFNASHVPSLAGTTGSRTSGWPGNPKMTTSAGQ